MSDNPLADKLDDIENKVDENLENDKKLPDFMESAIKKSSAAQQAITDQSLRAVSNLGNSITGTLKSQLRSIGSTFAPSMIVRRAAANSGAMAPILNLGISATEKTFDASKEFLSGILTAVKAEREALENDSLLSGGTESQEELLGSSANESDGILDRIANGIEDMVEILKSQLLLDEDILETQREQAFAQAEALFESKKKGGPKLPMPPVGGGKGGEGGAGGEGGSGGVVKGFISNYLDDIIGALLGARLALWFSAAKKGGGKKVFTKAASRVFGKFLTGAKFIGRVTPLLGFIVDGIFGAMEFKDASKFSSFIGGALGGTFNNKILNTFVNAGKWALLGATIGSAFPIVGTIAGGILGAIIGAILGAIGGETIAKKLDELMIGIAKRWLAFYDTIFYILFGTGVEEVFVIFKEKVLEIVGWVTTFLEEQKKNFLRGLNILSEGASNLWAAISEEFDLVIGFLKETLIKVIGKENYERIVNLVSMVVDKVVEIFDFILEKMKQLLGILKKKVVEPVKKVVVDAGGGMKIMGQQFKEALVEGKSPVGTMRRARQDLYAQQGNLLKKFRERNSESDALFLKLLDERLSKAKSASDVGDAFTQTLSDKSRKRGEFAGLSNAPRKVPKTQPKETFGGKPADVKSGTLSKNLLKNLSDRERKAILAAAKKEGVDPAAMFAIAAEESAFRGGKNPKSSASGLFQITTGTFRGAGGDFSKRYEPEEQSRITAKLMKRSAKLLKDNKFEVNAQNLRLMHFFGEGDGIRFLEAERKNSNQLARNIFSKNVIRSNPRILGGTLSDARKHLTKKYTTPEKVAAFDRDVVRGDETALAFAPSKDRSSSIFSSLTGQGKSVQETQKLAFLNNSNTGIREKSKKMIGGSPNISSSQSTNNTNNVSVNPKPNRNDEPTFVRTEEANIP